MNEKIHYLKFKNWEKYAFHQEKWNSESIGNNTHTA